MVTIFNCKDNTEQLTKGQYDTLITYIEAYKESEDGKWLNQVPYKSVTYLWGNNLVGSDIQAIRPMSFSEDIIILQPSASGNTDFWVQLMAAPAIHELRHIYQQMKYGIILYSISSALSKIPFMYSIAPTEVDAFREQDKALELIMELQ